MCSARPEGGRALLIGLSPAQREPPGVAVTPRAAVLLRRLSLGLALAAGGFAAYISLVPFHFVLPGGTRETVALFLDRFEMGMTSRGNFIANVLLFVPVGFFGLASFVTPATRAFRRLLSIVVVLVSSVLLSVSIEFFQTLVPGRTPSLADIVAQAI